MAQDFAQQLLEKEEAAIAKVNAARTKQLSELPSLALRWLALAPGWTTLLARAAGFPAADPQSFFETVVANGFGTCTTVVPEPSIDTATGRIRLPEPEVLYTLNPTVAREVVSSMPATSGGPTAAPKDVATIASAVLKAAGTGLKLHPTVSAWAQLATRAENPSALAAFLLKSVDDGLGNKQFPDAVRWIEAAAPLD